MSSIVQSRSFARRHPDLAGARVLVVGLGKSGLAAARLAAAHGAQVTAVDGKTEAVLGPAAVELRRLGARVHFGGHPPELAGEADLVVPSPGVAPEVPLLARARELGLPVWAEVELAARFCQGRIAGVTGSNGKSTVTSMIGTVLRAAGIAGGTGGNLGTPFSDLLVDDGPAAWHALELSSFQLEAVETLGASVAVVLNLSSNHLDRHPSMEAYARAKARLLELQPPEGHAVLNADDPASARFRDSVRGRLWLFSVERPVERGAFLRSGRLVLCDERGTTDLLAADELLVPGAHNVANALAAALASHLAGCDARAIADGLRSYRGLPHRLERVRELAGVTFYNDSKATSPASTACALRAFAAGSVQLILGGRDKGADWSPLVPLIERHARRVLLVGQAAPMLAGLLARHPAVESWGTIERAVEAGLRGAAPGDVVLLAPGCASFDQYRDFEERGDDFRRAVLALGEPRRG
jgi:UDP-N-acetylmuramoylalanine--D-glutamate ligase